MEHRSPSGSAIGTAVHRAAHLLLDEDPKILVDPFARALAGYASDDEMLQALASLQMIEFPCMRAVFTVRSRYAEDELARAINRGIDQYIILGAGLDSFAYRRPDLIASLDIFEVDHPASQAWKRTRVAELGIAPPTHLHHVSIDFERQTLGEGLAESIVDLGKPVFLSLLGVTQYLTPDAALRTLRDVAATTAPGSELVFQFVVPPTTLARDEAALVTAFAKRNGAAGEPWLSYFEPAEMERHLLRAGFDGVVHFGREEATERYLRGRGDGLCMPAYFHMIKASIACSRHDQPPSRGKPIHRGPSHSSRRHAMTRRPIARTACIEGD
jgi:methyltransferase (TIGR00027 family)